MIESMNRRHFLGGAAGLVSAAVLSRSAFAASSAAPAFRFADVTDAAGIRFHHNSGAYGGSSRRKRQARCAFLDYDADGWQISLVNGGLAEAQKQRSTLRSTATIATEPLRTSRGAPG
jgi:hypothetical protein